MCLKNLLNVSFSSTWRLLALRVKRWLVCAFIRCSFLQTNANIDLFWGPACFTFCLGRFPFKTLDARKGELFILWFYLNILILSANGGLLVVLNLCSFRFCNLVWVVPKTHTFLLEFELVWKRIACSPKTLTLFPRSLVCSNLIFPNSHRSCLSENISRPETHRL